jgi:hypothetical protein
MVQLLFFAQSWIFERAFARWQRASVRAMDQTMGMQDFQILPDSDLRSLELPGEFRNQNPSLVIQQIEDGAASFFVEHRISLNESALPVAKAAEKRISFYSVLFRLSRGKNGTGAVSSSLYLF